MYIFLKTKTPRQTNSCFLAELRSWTKANCRNLETYKCPLYMSFIIAFFFCGAFWVVTSISSITVGMDVNVFDVIVSFFFPASLEWVSSLSERTGGRYGRQSDE